jgi:hypothetical protein
MIRHMAAITLGAATLISSVALLVWDRFPEFFPLRAHDYLAAFALAGIAVALLVWPNARRRADAELLKTALLAAAFLFWAANQLWPAFSAATLFNDLAVGLFVLDVFLTMVGWPAEASS